MPTTPMQFTIFHCMRKFNITSLCVPCLLLLMFCYSFASDKNTKPYPKEINCIVNEYVARFPKWQKNHQSIHEENLRRKLVRDQIIDSSQVIYAEVFEIFGNKKYADFDVTIWTMKSSAYAEKSFELLRKEIARDPGYIEKPPRELFVFKEHFIWANARSFSIKFVMKDELNKIINMCFE